MQHATFLTEFKAKGLNTTVKEMILEVDDGGSGPDDLQAVVHGAAGLALTALECFRVLTA